MKKIRPWLYAFTFFIILALVLAIAYFGITKVNNLVNNFIPPHTLHTSRVSTSHDATKSSPHKPHTKKHIPTISPSYGSSSGGDTVVIHGNDLSNALAVTIGGENAKIVTNTNTSITVIAPSSNGYTGAVNVDVTKSDKSTITLGKYKYELLPPTITSISPASGATAGGDVVTIKGDNLLNATGVTFDGINSKIISNKANAIKVKTPLHIHKGDVNVTVNTIGGSITKKNAYDYRHVPPIITTVSPHSGSIRGGNSVKISGKYLLYPENITFGNSYTTPIANTANSITVIAPLHYTTGTVDISVTTADGTTKTPKAYTYLIPPPSISRISMTSGSTLGGDAITIDGTNLSNALEITFDAVRASITNNTQHSITVITPPHSVGPASIAVKTKGGSATSPQTYSYVSPIPHVTSISPDVGSTTGGASIVIHGSNLSDATSVNFGAVHEPSFRINESGDSISVVTPEHNAGTYFITVSTSGGTSATTNTARYTYVVPAPIVTSMTPTSGLTTGGESVTIFGRNLLNTTEVMFGTVAVSFNVISSTEIVATAPPGNVGRIAVEVITDGGSDYSPQPYSYIAQ